MTSDELRCDVAIIGSGVGGMTAAGLLTLAGYKTIVVEKLPLIGGRCSSFNYKGFELSTGVIILPMDGGPIEPIFRELGADFDLRPQPEYQYYRINGVDHEVRDGKGTLRTLLSFVSKEEEATKVMEALQKTAMGQVPSSSISFRDWLAQHTDNPGILEVFQIMVNFLYGLRIDELPAPEFFYTLRETSHLRNFGIAPRGTGKLMRSLADSIEQRGNPVWTRSRVKRITVEEGTVTGLTVEREGKVIEIKAQAVISNAGPQKTVDLAGQENFEKSYLKKVKENLRPVPYIFIAIAAEEPLLGDRMILMLSGTRRLHSISCPTVLCPELAPPGKHLLYAAAGPSQSLPPFDMKNELELCHQDLREILPQFDAKAEILMASCFQRDWPLYRTWSGYDLPQKTPIENLYNVGDGVKPSGMVGLPACAQSAHLVVADLKNRIGPS
ncbi:MAG: NAD(P)/FAD-dependent oxidoreductase [Desulfatiglans sp.]|jgi:phytoene dehydrogenase-like protein|nr:NAD(P)/FAD-dependent oxidoreductase [Desulfatiglans sp.]